MNMKTPVVALSALAVGVVAGWIAKPTPVAVQSTRSPDESTRKARIADSKSRVKMVTTVVTNTVHEIGRAHV